MARDKKVRAGELPHQVGNKGDGPWQNIVRAAQGNFDHLMSLIRNVATGLNLLADDVEDIQQVLEGNIETTNEHAAQLAEMDELSHADLNDIEPDDHHDPVTVGTGLDVTGQLVELSLDEVAAGGELGGFLDAPTVDATHSGSTHSTATDAHIADTTEPHDHGNLAGLGDDDHPQYLTEAEGDAAYADITEPIAVAHRDDTTDVHDHGQLAGLSDDDHPQYATNAEFDDHSARHEDGGADEISLTGLSGTPADLATHAAAENPHGAELDDLTDVNAPTPAAGDVLTWDDTPGEWVAGAGGSGVTDHGALTGLTDDDHTQYVLESLLDGKGELYVASADNTPDNLAVGADKTILAARAGATLGVEWQQRPDVQIYDVADSPATWTKPSWATWVEIICIGGGGGGGSGRRGSAGTTRFGGGGGAGGDLVMAKIPAAALGATEDVVVGAGGAGGAAISTADTNGLAGTGGGNSSFGTGLILAQGGDNGGAGGTVAGGRGSFSAGSSGQLLVPGGWGASSSVSAASDADDVPNAINDFPGGRQVGSSGGGGAGGGINTSNVERAGGDGGTCGPLTGGTGGVINTSDGTDGEDAPADSALPGPGGGGGAGFHGGSTFVDGGIGGLYGGGGGGGGAKSNNGSSGAGGAGGDGIVIVVSW